MRHEIHQTHSLKSTCFEELGSFTRFPLHQRDINRVVKWWRHKNYASEIMVLFSCSEPPIPERFSFQYGPLTFKLLHTKPSYLVLVHFIRNQSKIREFSVGLYGTLNGSIFTLSRASDLKFGKHSCSLCVHRMCFWRLKVKSCKTMTSHFTILYPTSIADLGGTFPHNWASGAYRELCVMLWHSIS